MARTLSNGRTFPGLKAVKDRKNKITRYSPTRVSGEELEFRSLARDAPFFYSLIRNPSFLLSAHSFQASIKVQAGRRRNSRRKGRETEARLTSSFPFCSRCGLRFLQSKSTHFDSL